MLFAEGYAKKWWSVAGVGIRDVILLKLGNYLDFCDFFLIVFNLRTAPDWHMWQRACVCFLYLRLYRDGILGVRILLEKERLKATEFRKTWTLEGKDSTKPKFPNKLFQEQKESVRERKICVAHPLCLDCIYCRFETKLFWAEFLNWELNRCPSANITRFVKLSPDFGVENMGILEVGLCREGITMKGWTVRML